MIAIRERLERDGQVASRNARNVMSGEMLRQRTGFRHSAPAPRMSIRSRRAHPQEPAPMPVRPYLLAETTWKTVREARYEVAVLPWGATEAHNYHLPYGTDNVACDYIAAAAAQVASEAVAR